jgi:signal transduction histidine kinase
MRGPAYLIFLIVFAIPILSVSQDDSLQYWLKDGAILFDQGKFEASKTQFEKAKKIAPAQSAMQLEINNNLGNIAGYLGQPEVAIGHYQEALQHVQYSKDPISSESSIKKNIAATYSDLKDFPNSFRYLREAENLARSAGEPDLIADCLNNKGILYEQTDSIQKALQAYEEARSYYRSVQDFERLAMVNVNIGVVAKNLNKLDEALLAYDSALFFTRQIPNAFYESVILNNRGNVLSLLERHAEAISDTEKALAIARELGQMNLVQECLESLAHQHAAAGNYLKGFELHKEFSALKDSLINDERIATLSEMETKYDVKKKEIQLLQLQSDNLLIEKQKTRMGIYISILAILIGILIVGVIIRQRIQKLEQHKKELQLVTLTEKNERERIAKDMHDELGSGISRITWITAAAQRQSQKEEFQDSFQKIEHISVQLAQGMRSLIWLLNTGATGWDKFISLIRELTGQLTEESNLQVEIKGTEIFSNKVLKANAARDLMLLIKEAVHNAVKHASAKVITIEFTDRDGALSLTISDDGKGFGNSENPSGNGLKNMQVRAEQMNGTAKIESAVGKGTSVYVELPGSEIFV